MGSVSPYLWLIRVAASKPVCTKGTALAMPEYAIGEGFSPSGMVFQ
jgi:hypothetical protein